MKEIKLTQGFVTQVDDEDYEFLNQWKWCAAKYKDNYYAVRSVRTGKNVRHIKMHRLLLKVTNNIWTDHVDGNSLNNQKVNLRTATASQNACNRGLYNNKTSKYKGVFYSKERKKCWRVLVAIDGKNLPSKGFEKEEDAGIYSNLLMQRAHKAFARLNSI
jgi:hypothetical protein